MNLLKTNSKLFISIFGIISALLIILAIAFMTQYSNIHVAYQINTAGEVVIKSDSKITAGTYAIDNRSLAYYLNSTNKESPVTMNFDEASPIIYDFQQKMNAFNNFITVTFAICIVAVAVLFIFSNHSRNVYYKSNLIAGIAAPAVAIIISLVAMIWCFTLLSNFNANSDLYKITAVMQKIDLGSRDKRPTSMTFDEFITTYASNVNTLTFILTIVAYLLVIASAALVAVNAVMKYFATAGRRKEIIERAMGVQNV